ncbi:hypothetical protein Tco_1334633 [Tanacetum coccineum]
MTSSTISAIYIQQFWDTMCFNSSTGLYNCQLDEQWFNLHKDILRDALDITPSNDTNPFVAPPSSDTVIELLSKKKQYVGIPLYTQERKTAGYDRPRHPVLQILWGITHRSNIDYAERIWEEFVQSIQTFLTDRKNLATASRGKKKTAHLLIPNVRYVGKDGREIFGMPIPDALLTDAIKSAPYYNSYLEHVTEYQRYLNEEHDKADDKSPEPASSQPPKPTPTPTESSKKDQGKKRKLVMESTDAPSPAKRSKAGKVTKKRMPKSSLQFVMRIQPLIEVQGKGKEKVAKEQAAHDLLTLQTPKPKNPADQFIFQRRTPMPTEPSEHADSPSLDVKLTLTDSEMESVEEVLVIKAGDQDKARLGPTMVNKIKLGYE